jgi:hypothetical protein
MVGNAQDFLRCFHRLTSPMNTNDDHENLSDADDAKIELFRPFVDLVLYAFGISPEEALWVSDESIIADFVDSDEDLIDAIERLGFMFEAKDHVWEIAARLKQQTE